MTISCISQLLHALLSGRDDFWFLYITAMTTAVPRLHSQPLACPSPDSATICYMLRTRTTPAVAVGNSLSQGNPRNGHCNSKSQHVSTAASMPNVSLQDGVQGVAMLGYCSAPKSPGNPPFASSDIYKSQVSSCHGHFPSCILMYASPCPARTDSNAHASMA